MSEKRKVGRGLHGMRRVLAVLLTTAALTLTLVAPASAAPWGGPVYCGHGTVVMDGLVVSFAGHGERARFADGGIKVVHLLRSRPVWAPWHSTLTQRWCPEYV